MFRFMKKANDKVNEVGINAMTAMASKRGEGYVDSGMKILIAVVLGAALLAALTTLMNDTIIGTVTTKITELFASGGTT